MSIRVTTGTEAAVKAVFAGIGLIVMAIIAPFIPPLIPPGLLTIGVWAVAVEVWGWHPLFAGLLSAAALLTFLSAAFAMIYKLPRALASSLIALYLAFSYGLTFHAFIGLDAVWSGAAAIVAGAVGIPAGRWLKDRLNEKFGRSFADLIAVVRPNYQAARAIR